MHGSCLYWMADLRQLSALSAPLRETKNTRSLHDNHSTEI